MGKKKAAKRDEALAAAWEKLDDAQGDVMEARSALEALSALVVANTADARECDLYAAATDGIGQWLDNSIKSLDEAISLISAQTA